MKLIGASCILVSAILCLLSIRRTGKRKLAIYRESIGFLEFARNKIFLAATPIPEIVSDYRVVHSESLLFPNIAESPLSDYFCGVGETGMEGELRRIDGHIIMLSETLKTIERETSVKNQLIVPLFLSAAMILILILL